MVTAAEFARVFERSTKTNYKETRGAKRTFDRELFLHVAYKIAWKKGGKFTSQEKFIDEALTAFGEATTGDDSPGGQFPSREWARPLISEIWNNLGLKKQPNSF